MSYLDYAYTFGLFLNEGLGDHVMTDLVLTPAYEADCVWLLRWLTLEAIPPISYAICEAFVSELGEAERFEHERLMAEMAVREGDDEEMEEVESSMGSYHPSDVEMDYEDH